MEPDTDLIEIPWLAVSLKITDVCDAAACGAQARVRVGRNGLRLDFCAHHYADFELVLLVRGWEIADDTRAELLARPMDAA